MMDNINLGQEHQINITAILFGSVGLFKLKTCAQGKGKNVPPLNLKMTQCKNLNHPLPKDTPGRQYMYARTAPICIVNYK
jgi:hypothetical protein